jgi:hypothetical protein
MNKLYNHFFTSSYKYFQGKLEEGCNLRLKDAIFLPLFLQVTQITTFNYSNNLYFPCPKLAGGLHD